MLLAVVPSGHRGSTAIEFDEFAPFDPLDSWASLPSYRLPSTSSPWLLGLHTSQSADGLNVCSENTRLDSAHASKVSKKHAFYVVDIYFI